MMPLEASPRFKAIFLVLGFASLVAIAVVGARHSGIIPALTRDPVAVAGLHPLTGLLSTPGLLIWSAAAIWLCTWIVANAHRAQAIARLARWSRILTCWLAFDDGFQFHEYLAPRLFQIGEKTALAALLFAVIPYLAGFRAQLAHGTYLLAGIRARQLSPRPDGGHSAAEGQSTSLSSLRSSGNSTPASSCPRFSTCPASP